MIVPKYHASQEAAMAAVRIPDALEMVLGLAYSTLVIEVRSLRRTRSQNR